MGLRMHDGQIAHIDHAQFARRAILPQVGLLQLLIFRSILLVIPPRHKGRTRRHERGAECGGREGAGDVQHQSGRRSRVVLAPRGLAPSSRRTPKVVRGRRWQTGWFTEEHGVSRNPSRREGRSVSVCTCGHRARANSFCAAAPGAAATRSSLHPLVPQRVTTKQISDANTPRER